MSTVESVASLSGLTNKFVSCHQFLLQVVLTEIHLLSLLPFELILACLNVTRHYRAEGKSLTDQCNVLICCL